MKTEKHERVMVEGLVSTDLPDKMFDIANGLVESYAYYSDSSEGPFEEVVFHSTTLDEALDMWSSLIKAHVKVAACKPIGCSDDCIFLPLRLTWRVKPEILKYPQGHGFYSVRARFKIAPLLEDDRFPVHRSCFSEELYESWSVRHKEHEEWNRGSHIHPQVELRQ